MRKIQSLTSWQQLKRQLLENKNYHQVYEKMKPEYELANSLIEIRLKKRLSQKKLAEKIGSKQPVISRLEATMAKPSLSLLSKISKVLDVRLRVYFQQ